MPGGDWGFVKQTTSSNITPPPWAFLTKSSIDTKVAHADSIRDQRRTADIQAHVTYLYNKSPSTPFEHKKYAEGWDTGFTDAKAFFMWRTGFGAAGKIVSADKIGCFEIFVRKRLGDAEMQRDKFAWEWEAGYRKAVAGFWDAVGV